MGRVLMVDIPSHNDDDWLRERLRDLDKRLEDLVENAETEEIFNDLGACLDIVNAMQQYAGY